MKQQTQPSRIFQPLYQQRKEGWTITELLVVVGTLAVLVAILVPVVSRQVEASRSIGCTANLRGLGNVFQMWRSENGGVLAPPLAEVPNRPSRHFFEAGLIDGPYLFICPSAATLDEGAWIDASSGSTPYRRLFSTMPISIGINALVMYETYIPGNGVNKSLWTVFENEPEVPLFMDTTAFQMNRNAWLNPERDRIAVRHQGKANVIFMDGRVESLDREGLSTLHPLGDESRTY